VAEASPIFGSARHFTLEPFVHAVEPISHHGEDGIVGRRLSAAHEFFSAGNFQLFCHSEQPCDGIPVSGSTGVLQDPIQQWRKF
jgi:hypothetical protein